jgi:hypothetical protein
VLSHHAECSYAECCGSARTLFFQILILESSFPPKRTGSFLSFKTSTIEFSKLFTVIITARVHYHQRGIHVLADLIIVKEPLS